MSSKKVEQQYYFTLRGFWKRVGDEYRYYTRRPWSLRDVGAFWDTVTDYDEVNERLYTYFRRFTNSYDLALRYLPRSDYNMLDIQARSGNGTLFWHEQGKIARSVCVDFSEYLKSLADRRLRDTGLCYSTMMVLDLPLPFDDEHFDLVCSYETIEHIYDYEMFFDELVRVLRRDGILILTCPNWLWEWVHWLSAAININHSEGPHRFLKRRELFRCFRKNNMMVLAENSTILLPFNNRISIAIDRFLERHLPQWVMRLLALRRTFVLSRGEA